MFIKHISAGRHYWISQQLGARVPWNGITITLLVKLDFSKERLFFFFLMEFCCLKNLMQVWLYQNIKCQILEYFISHTFNTSFFVFISGVAFQLWWFYYQYYINLEESNNEQLLTMFFYHDWVYKFSLKTSIKWIKQHWEVKM